MSSYEVTIEFEPMVVKVEVDDDGVFSIDKIKYAARDLDSNGHVYHDDWWVGYVEDVNGDEVWSC